MVSKTWKKKNADPNNPFKPGTIRAALYEEDFSDLTAAQIGEVFAMEEKAVKKAMIDIKAKTGKIVEYKKTDRQMAYGKNLEGKRDKNVQMQ